MRILIADDHDLVRDTLKAYLEQSAPGMEVLAAGTLAEAVDLAATQPRLDLILLDIDMPGMDGLLGLDVVAQRHRDIPIAIISGLVSVENVVGALERGAIGFIPKTIGAKAMLGALQLMLAGERYVPSFIVDEVDRRLSEQAAGPPAGLTDRLTTEEAGILALLKQGHANKEIARTLGIEEYTVKYHLRGVFKKLGAKNRTQAVTIALERDLP